jgi:hypothetical protein
MNTGSNIGSPKVRSIDEEEEEDDEEEEEDELLSAILRFRDVIQEEFTGGIQI